MPLCLTVQTLLTASMCPRGPIVLLDQLERYFPRSSLQPILHVIPACRSAPCLPPCPPLFSSKHTMDWGHVFIFFFIFSSVTCYVAPFLAQSLSAVCCCKSWRMKGTIWDPVTVPLDLHVLEFYKCFQTFKCVDAIILFAAAQVLYLVASARLLVFCCLFSPHLIAWRWSNNFVFRSKAWKALFQKIRLGLLLLFFNSVLA